MLRLLLEFCLNARRDAFIVLLFFLEEICKRVIQVNCIANVAEVHFQLLDRLAQDYVLTVARVRVLPLQRELF